MWLTLYSINSEISTKMYNRKKAQSGEVKLSRLLKAYGIN